MTFLFTDIEGSTQLWEQHRESIKAALARHDAILQAAIEGQHGHVVKSTGDGLSSPSSTTREIFGHRTEWV